MPAHLDQHFLNDEGVAADIIAAADLKSGEPVIEIGPGRGVLTRRLLKAGAKVTAVEFDPKLVEALKDEFADQELSIIHSDWLKLDLDKLPAPAKIVANLPYSVATPILQRLLDWPHWELAVLMFQKEVARRILAEPATKPYGLLSLSVSIKADAEILCEVPAAAFAPPPKVRSAVVVFHRLRASRLPGDVEEKEFFRVLKAAFGQRRKMAAKNLSSVLGLSRSEVDAIFKSCGLDIDARAETISLDGFIQLCRCLAPR